MIQLKEYTGEYLLRVGLKDLHAITQRWIAEVDFACDELEILLNIITKLHLRSMEASSETKNLNHVILNYRNEIFDELRKKLMLHEHKLSKILDNQMDSHEEGYRVEHINLSEELNQAFQGYKGLKQRIYLLIKSETEYINFFH